MRIQVGGTTVGEIPNGTALLVERAPGPTTVSVDHSMSMGRWAEPVTLEPGKEYYFDVAYRGSAVAASMFGFIGAALEHGAQPKDKDGPAELRPVSRDEALAKLPSLRVVLRN